MLQINESFEIVVGTYDDFIVGYNLYSPSTKKSSTSGDKAAKKSKLSKQTLEIEQSFALRAHSGIVKSIEATKQTRFLVSAGNDEVANLYELDKNRMSHSFECAANCLAFVKSTHIVIGSEDCDIYIYNLKSRTQRSLELIKVLKGHKKPIIDLSIHPSNKLFVSISKDHTMRTWNLVTGRQAFVTNINPKSHLVEWSPSGEKFIIAAENEILIFNTSDGSSDFTNRFEKRINDLKFLSHKNILALGTDDGKIIFLCLTSKTPIITLKAHDSRIKSLRLMDRSIKEEPQEDDDEEEKNETSANDKSILDPLHLMTTCSSDGTIKVWQLDCQMKEDPQMLASVETGARLTCMATSATIK